MLCIVVLIVCIMLYIFVLMFYLFVYDMCHSLLIVYMVSY